MKYCAHGYKVLDYKKFQFPSKLGHRTFGSGEIHPGLGVFFALEKKQAHI
jgi:hypothetical protein